MEYDVIIIGSGLSGLAAAVRLTHFGRKVRIFERHFLPGGLNSWYHRHGEVIDVGLHALTNYASAEQRSAPFNKLLRQLRLRREELELCPQTYSTIEMPGHQLRLSNDFAAFQEEICRKFPDQAAGFKALLEHILASDYFASQAPFQSAKKVVAEYLTSRELSDLLFMPLMYYGNPHVGDMDFKQFCIMFHSVFMEGLSRPRAGMKAIIQTLLARIRDAGGEISLNNGIVAIHGDGKQITAVTDGQGKTHQATAFLSCIGARETANLCDHPPQEWKEAKPGQMGFIETIFRLDQPPINFGAEACTIFSCQKPTFDFFPPAAPVDYDSQLYCMPGNYQGCEKIPAALQLRMTHLANPAYWLNLNEDDTKQAKNEAIERQKEMLSKVWPGLPKAIIAAEVHTPKTIFRYSGHLNGSIYGSPDKFSSGTCSLKNLFLCGTDQGLVGIVGSMISGVATVNQYLFN